MRVWDLPLRLFHWLLVLCVIGLFATIKNGRTDAHMLLGYTALSLILFRVLWGFVGPRYARFSSFCFSPASLMRYLRGAPDAPRTLGHTPLGALSVFALLLAIGVQAVSGLFVSDDILAEGPLVKHASSAVVDAAGWLHHANERIILLLVLLHLLAMLVYRLFRRIRLVGPMVSGDRIVPSPGPGDMPPSDALALAARDDAGVRIRALVVAVVAVAVVATIVNWS